MLSIKPDTKSLIAVAIGILVALFLYCILTPFWGLNGITNLSLNMFPHEKPAEPVIICIDDASLGRYGPWPWPRRFLSKLVTETAKSKPRAIGLDILLTEKGPDDALLADSFRKAGVVCLAKYLNLRGKTSWGKTRVFGGSIEEPVQELKAAAARSGFIDVFSAPDDTVKLVHLRFKNHRSLPFALIKTAYPDFRMNQESFILKIGAKPRDFTRISAMRVLDGSEGSQLNGKVVLIGVTATGISDQALTSATSLGRIPGIYLHAYTLANLLEWGGLTAIPGIFILLLTLLILGGLSIKPFYSALKVGFCVIAAVFAMSIILYARGLWFSPLYPTIAIIVTLSARWLWFTLDLQTEKNRTRGYLGKYLSPIVLDNIADGSDLQEPMIRDVTVLFVDLRGYTHLAENSSPTQVVGVLNKLLGTMADIIIENGGTIDKFTGDGILAFFHDFSDNKAQMALKAALEIQKSCRRPEKELAAGVGIATGPVSVGCIGSNERRDYTIIGDTVNIAARLEKLAGQGEILADEATAQAAGVLGENRMVNLKGRSGPVKIIRLTANDDTIYSILKEAERNG